MKKHLLPSFIFFILFSPNLFSQNVPSIVWEKSYGGTGDDEASAIRQTSDGGFIVAGDAYSNDVDVSGNHGASDFWIVKTDVGGTIQWQKCLGGTSNDVASSIQQTTDDGYIIAGFSKSSDGDVSGHHGTSSTNDCWVVKLDSLQNIAWQESLGGSLNDYANSIEQTHDGGYIVGGFSYSIDGDVTGHHGGTGTADYWIVKLDTSGAIEWQRSLGGTFIDFGNAVVQTTDGGYIVAGSSSSDDGDVSGNHGGTDDWIVKLDSQGNIVWQKSFGGSSDDGAASVQQTSTGDYIIAGWSKSTDGDVTGNHGDYDVWVLKIDTGGTLLWQKSLGGNSLDWGNTVLQASDGGFIVAGYTQSYGGDVQGYHGGNFWGDYWVVRLDSSGNLFSQKCLGGTNDEYAASIDETSDGDIVVGGWSESSDDDVSVNYGSADFWVVDLSVPTTIEQQINSASLFSISPNPANDILNIQFRLQNNFSASAEISITDLAGKILAQKTTSCINGYINESIPLSEKFSSGIYFVRVSNDRQQWSAPLVVEK